MPIWYSENIKTGGTSLFKLNFAKKEIIFITNLTNKEGDLLSYKDVQEMFNVKTQFLEYTGLVSSIKCYFKSLNFPKK